MGKDEINRNGTEVPEPQRQLYASLHTHMLDRFDSQNDPDRLFARLKELGAAGCAVTQHGMASAIEPARRAAEKYGLKMVPGIEMYVGKQHLIILAANDDGWKALCTCITDANNKDGIAVATEELLMQHFGEGSHGHGNVIATSACINGVIASRLRANEEKEHEIRKLEKKRGDAVSPDAGHMAEVLSRLEAAEVELREKTELKNAAKKAAGIKFAAREKQAARMKERGLEGAEEALRGIEADKAAAAKAKENLAALTRECARLSRMRSMLTEEKKELEKAARRWEQAENNIRKLRSGMEGEGVLIRNAEEKARFYDTLFGHGNFYMEVQNHGMETEARVYPKLVKIARKLGIPLVASNDVHTLGNSPDELLQRQILRSLRFGTSFEELREEDRELYLKTDEELKNWLLRILPEEAVTEAMANIRTVFDRCNVTFAHGNHYPAYALDGPPAEELLESEVEKGIAWRFPDGFPDEEAYRERLRHELDIIEKMGYAEYHLIVKDFLEYARALGSVPAEKVQDMPLTVQGLKETIRKNGWHGGFTTGPGRGSAVGSLTCYLLGITALDPVKYGLYFERFLNPERVSMPDIDSDLAKRVRPKVIQYVQARYGSDSVCGIMTTNAQAPRGAIRIAAKFYGLKECHDARAFLRTGDIMAKSVPDEPDTAFSTVVDGKTIYQGLLDEYGSDPHAAEIIRWAGIIEGCFTTYGAHAAGIVISDSQPIKEYMPLRWNEKLKEWTTQCDMAAVEENGCLKMDLLGLKTLDIITETLDGIEQATGRCIDPLSDIPLDDARVFREIFCTGRTDSVFQFESAGMKGMLKRFRPECFEDLIILVSMFRPGPMQYLDSVIEVKNGKAPEYVTPELAPILGKTYGAIVYQEQVMEIFQELAGYTLGGADQVRRFMSKKKADKLAHEREAFINGDEARGIPGCVKNGITTEAAGALFSQMEEFARYAFNKSHAAAYAWNSYVTAWLKLYCPAEYLAAAMNWAELDKIPGLMSEARAFGVTVEAPDANRSGDVFTVRDRKILFGLGGVKNVGAQAGAVIREREANGPYTSPGDLVLRTRINKTAYANLVKAGALDWSGHPRAALLAASEPLREKAKKAREKTEKAECLEEMAPLMEGLTTKEAVQEAQERAGLKALLKKPESPEKVLKKAHDARAATRALMEELDHFPMPDVKDDLETRMAEEHALLGAYVTAHPLDGYPAPPALGCMPIGQLEEGQCSVLGVVTDIRLKKRRSDGRPMAFLTLEDRTGSIEVCVFTAQYARTMPHVHKGKPVIVRGRAITEGHYTEEEDRTELKLVADTAETPHREKEAYILTTYSIPLWHATEEKAFKEMYGQESGHPVTVIDVMTGVPRKLTYRVSGKALERRDVRRAVPLGSRP